MYTDSDVERIITFISVTDSELFLVLLPSPQDFQFLSSCVLKPYPENYVGRKVIPSEVIWI